LTAEEHYRVLAVCVEQTAGRVPVIAGCGSNDTASAKRNMKAAHEHGADAALVVLPYYNRPNQDGLYAHFAVLAEASTLPIILYNVPSRTVTDLDLDTLVRIAQIPTVVGIKDASGNLARVSAQRLACGADFAQLSGNDDMALGFNAMGGVGAISVTANVAPRLCAEFQNACQSGDWATALTLQDRLYPLHAALFSDASPGPAKYALSRVRPDFPIELRLPMTLAGELSRRVVDAALEHAGLVETKTPG
jgi:4-hydroxy-tetrahydrodipicolinate synthase